MCGIVGIVESKKQVDENLLRKMRDALSHRGPNDSGIWIGFNKRVGLAHRRLSIIDLSSAGHQPMSDKKGKIWIIHNGEVYNFQEIRRELEKKGYRFKSNTDTEVVLYAYQEWGFDCLQKFNGMFAFGIYDGRKKQLFLARDRAGKKPLYYAQCNGKFVFASELKAILQDPEVPKKIDYRALNFFLTFGYIPFGFSIFECARKLLPAHAMTYNVETGDYKIWRYWDIPLSDGRKYGENELLQELEYLIEDAVRLRLTSDVPLGVFLSGGIDSSLVVAMMSKVSGRPVKTFSIGFAEEKYNELPYAKIVADYFRTEHTELLVKPDAFGILPELVKHFDEPFADSSMIPTYYVSKMTRGYVTVALSGDGGDELFGGYYSYLGTLVDYYIGKALPLRVRKGISRSAKLLPEKLIGKRQLLRLQYDPYRAFVDRMSHSYFNDRYRRKVLNPEIMRILREKYYEPEEVLYHMLIDSRMDFLNTLESTDFVSYLPDDILTKVDRTSMKASLEVRCPLLDYRIVEFAFKKVGGGYKINGVKRKYLLKKLARRLLPKELNLNRKMGFAVPIPEWFKGELSPHIRGILFEEKSSLFNLDYIQKLLDEHSAGINHSGRLFVLLAFCLWEKERMGAG